MNLSGTVNTFRLLYAPKLARAHVVLNQFNDLTFPLGKCISANVKKKYGVDVPEPDIRAIIIDKDNCIAKPHSLEIWPAYKVGDAITDVQLMGRSIGTDCLMSLAKAGS